jgi:hypothetical protein
MKMNQNGEKMKTLGVCKAKLGYLEKMEEDEVEDNKCKWGKIWKLVFCHKI